MRFNEVKKILVLMVVAITISISCIFPLRAQTASNNIAAILNQILQRVNNLPASLVSLGAFMSAWMDPDTSPPTSAMQQSFTQLGSLITQNSTTQDSLQTSLNAKLLNNDGSNVYNANNTGGMASISKDPATPTSLKYANDLVYSSLLDAPFFAKDPRAGEAPGENKKIDSSLNYILNAGGLNLYHKRPGGGQGSAESKTRYQGFYNTIMAATSFNGYVLSNVYADKSQFTTLQQALIKQATDPKDWFAQVSSENIGFVLRQLLLYQSQIFVLLTQSLQLQKQMVAAQAMNTSVLIAVNQLNENTMASSARGENPSL